MTTTNTTTHPIDHALAIIIISIDALLWLINELAGFHSTTTTTTPAPAPATPTVAPTTPQPVPAIKTPAITKRQLQTLTGIKSSRYNKADLLKIATEKNLIH